MQEINVDVTDALHINVMSIVGGLYAMNASKAIGYLFIRSELGYNVVKGMFCHLEREIDPDQWSFYYDYKTKKYYRLDV